MTAVQISPARLGITADRAALFAGTFLVALALLAFEINTVRTINFAVGPSLIYLAIALAMLGLSGASSLLSLFDIRAVPVRREILLFWMCAAIAALLVYAHFLAADQKAALNAAVAEAGRAGGLKGVLIAGIGHGLKTAFVVGIGLSLPYFLFGALLALLFTTSDSQLYGRLYASDLIGAAAGCMAAILLMETTDYAVSVTAPAVVVLCAGVAYVWPVHRALAAAGAVAALALAVLPRSDWYAERIEPPVNVNYLARDYGYREEIREVWHDWNSYTRVGAVVWDGANARPHAMMSLANGDGMAWVWPYETNGNTPWIHPAARPAMFLDPPRNALVMFAGAGADMMSLYQYGSGATRVTGVELNAELVAGARRLPGYGVKELFDEPMVDLHIEEGRVFLERDTQLYDQILLSFSGATASYYAGALGGTTQFLFTYEGLEALFGRLTPDGYAVILQVNKVNVIGALRRYLDEHDIGTDPARTIVILFRHDDPDRFWTGTFDNNPLLFKPAGWSDAEIDRLEASAAAQGYQFAYAPARPTRAEFEPYAQVIEATDPGASLRALSADTGLRFEVITDDRPFYLDLFANGNYVDWTFWRTVLSGKITRFDELAHATRVIIVAMVAVLAFVVILGPLAVRRGPPRTWRSLYHLAFFFCLGAGFMLLEIGIMQRASLLVGNPGLAIAIVLGALILFTGVGSLASDRVFGAGLSHGAVAAAAALYAVAVGLFIGPAISAMLTWPLAAKIIGLVALIAPGGLIVGQLFPQGLALAQQDDTALVPWAWAINGALSTVTAGAAPLIAQAWGFSVLFFGSAGLYAIILLLPPYRRPRAAVT